MLSVLLFALGLSGTWACCPPEQWETTAFDMNSLDSHPYSMVIAHDDHIAMEAVVVHLVGVASVYRHYIKDFNTMTQYEFDPQSSGCTVTQLRETFLTKANCASGSAPGMTNMQHYGRVTVGLPPSTIQLDSVSYDLDGRKTYIGLGQNGCFPIYEKVKPLQGEGPNLMLFYFNTTASVTTPDIFTLPVSCQSTV